MSWDPPADAYTAPARLEHSTSARLIQYALMLGVLLTPFMMWRFIPSLQFTFSDGCFLAAAMLALFAGRLNLSPFGDLTPWWTISICIMLMGLGASSLINGDPIRFGISGSQYVFAYLVLPYLLFSGTITDHLRLAMIFVFSITAVQAFSIVMYYLYGDVTGALAWINHNFVTGAGRLGSFLGSANRNASVIMLTLPFVLYFAKTRMLPLWLCIGCTAILSLALILTASVTGFVGGVITALTFIIAVYSWRAWKPFAVAFAALALAFAGGFELPETFQNRVYSAFAEGDISEAGTYGGRMELIEDAFDISDDVGLVGIGADQFRAVNEQEAPVHNVLLLIWTEGGMFALLGWLSALSVLLYAAVRVFRFDRTAAGLMLAIGIAFFIVQNASTHMYARVWIVPILLALRIAVASRQQALDMMREHVDQHLQYKAYPNGR